MNSLEQAAKEMADELVELKGIELSEAMLCIIAKHMDAFAREQTIAISKMHDDECEENQELKNVIEGYDIANAQFADDGIKRRDVEIDQLKEQNRELLKDKESWDKIAAMVPGRPNAITWEHGVKILNHLQFIVEERAREALDKAALAKGDV